MIGKVFTALLISGGLLAANAQAQSMGSSLGLYVYPAQEQSQEQVGQDDYDCYTWAKQQTGQDPVAAAMAQSEQAPEQQKGGHAAKGAVAGAAAGAIIGDTGDAAKKGAAVGVIAGGAKGRRQKKQAEAQAQQQHEQQVAALDDFKRAYSGCMGGRGYNVQ